jgi:hypothetical protein
MTTQLVETLNFVNIYYKNDVNSRRFCSISSTDITWSMTKQTESKTSTPTTVTAQQTNRSPPASSLKPPIDFALEKIEIGEDNEIDIQHII